MKLIEKFIKWITRDKRFNPDRSSGKEIKYKKSNSRYKQRRKQDEICAGG